jgi:hypothetical protein
MYEKLVAIEVEDEEGNTQILRVKRLITEDPHNENAKFSNNLIFRPGGGAIAMRHDNRVMTIADDSIADAHERQRREVDEMRSRGMSTARTGGEGGMLPDEQRQAEAGAPAKRPRRGTRPETEGAQQAQVQESEAAGSGVQQ